MYTENYYYCYWYACYYYNEYSVNFRTGSSYSPVTTVRSNYARETIQYIDLKLSSSSSGYVDLNLPCVDYISGFGYVEYKAFVNPGESWWEFDDSIQKRADGDTFSEPYNEDSLSIYVSSINAGQVYISKPFTISAYYYPYFLNTTYVLRVTRCPPTCSSSCNYDFSLFKWTYCCGDALI